MSGEVVCRHAHEYVLEIDGWDDDDDFEVSIGCTKCDIQGTKIIRWEEVVTWSVGGGLSPTMVESPYPEGFDAPEGDEEDEDG